MLNTIAASTRVCSLDHHTMWPARVACCYGPNLPPTSVSVSVSVSYSTGPIFGYIVEGATSSVCSGIWCRVC